MSSPRPASVPTAATGPLDAVPTTALTAKSKNRKRDLSAPKSSKDRKYPRHFLMKVIAAAKHSAAVRGEGKGGGRVEKENRRR